MKSRMQHQGGWAATFVIVGIVLALGLAGGIYYLKTHMNEEVATNDSNTNSEIEKTLDGASDSAKDTTDDNASSNKTNNDDQQASSESNDTSKNGDTQKEDKNMASQSTNSEDALPETGPADVFVHLFAVASLTAASVAYVRSR